MLLIVDGLLCELGLFLKLLQFVVGQSVLLLQVFDLSETLQFFFINDVLNTIVRLIEAISMGCNTRMQCLSHRISLLLLGFSIKEGLDLVNLPLDGVDLLSFRSQFSSFGLQVTAAHDDFLLDRGCLVSGLKLFEG